MLQSSITPATGRRLLALGGCSLLLLLAAASSFGASIDEREQQWKTFEQLTPAELIEFDPRTSTPRDATIPYIPAEPYPFEPPYTAEEMGYRTSEFVHIGRWPSAMVDVFGVVTSSGYINQGVSVGYQAPIGRPGLNGYIHDIKPGEVYTRWLIYSVFPPDDEGSQQLWFPNRTDMEHRTKMDFFVYSPQLRRVRRQPQPRRDQRFPDNSQTFDDVIGRDPWEMDWQVLGTDIIYETIRFPDTRPSITLNVPGKGLTETPTASIKMLGDSYPFYRPDGGIDCWVLKATIRSDWLPDYGEKTLIFWVDKHYFYPIRMEKYGLKDELMMVEVRFADLVNKELGQFGYSSITTVYWNIEQDLIGYSQHDGLAPHPWTAEQEKMIFTPEFMRRQWLVEPIKSLVVIRDPEKFYLRPKTYPGKFPHDRNPTLPPAVQARVDAQEAAGHLVFESPHATAEAQTAP